MDICKDGWYGKCLNESRYKHYVFNYRNKSELEYEQLKEYIEDNNKNDNIQIFLIYKESNRYVVWWDDYSISLVNSIDGIEKEGMNYYLITNNTPYGSFFY